MSKTIRYTGIMDYMNCTETYISMFVRFNYKSRARHLRDNLRIIFDSISARPQALTNDDRSMTILYEEYFVRFDVVASKEFSYMKTGRTFSIYGFQFATAENIKEIVSVININILHA